MDTNVDVYETGTVELFNEDKGFGYIRPDNGGLDVAVHQAAMRDNSEPLKYLKQGDRVEYQLLDDPQGPRAVDVAILEDPR